MSFKLMVIHSPLFVLLYQGTVPSVSFKKCEGKKRQQKTKQLTIDVFDKMSSD